MKSHIKVDLALEKLCQNPMPTIPQRMWTDEDIRAFIKGLSTYGKDFFYISKGKGVTLTEPINLVLFRIPPTERYCRVNRILLLMEENI